MLYHLFLSLSEDIPLFNVFRYITFRCGSAIVTSLIICFIFGPSIIKWLKSKQGEGQPIRENGPESHLITKKGTPTMGGVMMLLAIVLSTILWADLTNPYIWITLFVTFGFGMVGFADDYLKLTKRNTKGLPGKMKLLVQGAISLLAALLIMNLSEESHATSVAFPFFKDLMIDLGIFYAVFAMVVMVGASNAVNLTDGLDGLATVPVIIAAACFGLIAYLVGRADYSQYLQISYIAGSGELSIICASVIGAGLGFLWFNAPPAMVFMGDTGSLSLGGLLGVVSVIAKHEIVLAIVGGLFVIEAVSVIIQVYYYKFSGGKRIFLMAPIHHHFEKKGWKEPTIVIRFWIIAVIFALLGLATLKLR